MVRSDDRMIIPSENDLKACVSSLKCEKMNRNRGYQKLVLGKFHTHKLVYSPHNDEKNMTWHGRSRMKILVKICEHAWAVLLRIYGLNPSTHQNHGKSRNLFVSTILPQKRRIPAV
jgi:hypothetical protein